MSLNGSQIKSKTVSNEDNDPNSRNPMLYDPLQEGNVKTSKTMQYVAAIVICFGAIAAGTALAWTSPVFVQLVIPDANTTISSNTAIALNTTLASNITHLNETQEITPLNATTISLNSTNITQNNTRVNTNDTNLNVTITSPAPLEIASSTEPTPINNSTDEGLKLTESEASWVGSLLAIGAFIGAVPSGYLADLIGRKYTAIVMDIPFIVSWLVTIYATSPGMLYFARFLIGISTGSFCVVAPMYISEIAETSIRGTLGTLFQLSLTIGILFTYLVGSIVSWTTLSAICLIIPICLFIGMWFLPETPTYLLKKGRRGDAALSLKWLWGKYCDSRSAIQLIQNDLDAAGGGASIADLFLVKSNLKGLFFALALMLFQQFSGINAVIFYTASIFKSAGSSMDASICTIVVGVVQVLMTFLSSLLIEKAGRKILLLFSSTIMAICLAILGAYYNIKEHKPEDVASIGWLPLLSVVMFIVTFSIGYGPIPWLMMGEFFMPDVKGIAVSLIVMFNWAIVFIITKSFGIMITNWGSDITFWFFSGCMVIGTAFVATQIFETKGKSAAQIQMQLAGEKVG